MLVTREPGHHRSQSLSSTLILSHLSGAEVLARGLIGTCTQIEPITEMSHPLPLATNRANCWKAAMWRTRGAPMEADSSASVEADTSIKRCRSCVQAILHTLFGIVLPGCLVVRELLNLGKWREGGICINPALIIALVVCQKIRNWEINPQKSQFVCTALHLWGYRLIPYH